MTVLLDSIQRLGLTFKRAATTNGGEWHGPCPACGGTDRCHVWPEQGEAGTWWCRGCDQGGDAISWLQAHEGKTFPQAAEMVGRILDPKSKPKRRARLGALDAPVRANHESPQQSPAGATLKDPAQVWQAHAWKLVNEAADRIHTLPDQLAWLASRGISAKTAGLCKLGWIEERGRDVYRARSGWGLPERLRPDGTPKKLWIPRGLSIPYWRGDTILRVRIRRAEGDPRYLILEGSATDPMPPMLLKGTARQAVGVIVTEAELDGIALWQAMGDVVSVLAMGSAQARPKESEVRDLVDSARWIGLVLDRDQAGDAGTSWWVDNFRPESGIVDLRPILPEGAKDPGEAVAQGLDLRSAIVQAMPMGFRMAAARRGALAGQSGNEGGGGMVQETAIPDDVRELGGILRRCPWVTIVWTLDPIRMAWDTDPAHKVWISASDDAARISQLLYFSAEVGRYLDEHPHGATGITGRNYWAPMGAKQSARVREVGFGPAPGPVEAPAMPHPVAGDDW